jgi:hypothetical protein
MNTLNELKVQLKSLQEKYSDKYFIFIGPYEFKFLNELKILDDYVYKKIQPSDNLLMGINNLDIWFIKYTDISGMRTSKTIFPIQLSKVNLRDL